MKSENMQSAGLSIPVIDLASFVDVFAPHCHWFARGAFCPHCLKSCVSREDETCVYCEFPLDIRAVSPDDYHPLIKTVLAFQLAMGELPDPFCSGMDMYAYGQRVILDFTDRYLAQFHPDASDLTRRVLRAEVLRAVMFLSGVSSDVTLESLDVPLAKYFSYQLPLRDAYFREYGHVLVDDDRLFHAFLFHLPRYRVSQMGLSFGTMSSLTATSTSILQFARSGQSIKDYADACRMSVQNFYKKRVFTRGLVVREQARDAYIRELHADGFSQRAIVKALDELEIYGTASLGKVNKVLKSA